MNNKKVVLTQGEVDYELGGGLGCWARSTEERRLDVGDTRVINGILMSVYKAKYKFFDSEYTWTPVDEKYNSFENLTLWINKA